MISCRTSRAQSVAANKLSGGAWRGTSRGGREVACVRVRACACVRVRVCVCVRASGRACVSDSILGTPHTKVECRPKRPAAFSATWVCVSTKCCTPPKRLLSSDGITLLFCFLHRWEDKVATVRGARYARHSCTQGAAHFWPRTFSLALWPQSTASAASCRIGHRASSAQPTHGTWMRAPSWTATPS